MSAPWRRLAPATLAALLALACNDLPGEVIGAYRITMRLEDNACGSAALPLADGHSYAVELRAEPPRGFWRVPRAAPIEGRYEEGTFEFAYGAALELGSADAGTSGCLVQREEQLRGMVERAPRDAGPAADDPEAPVLTGEHVIRFRADPSGRCRDARGPLGPFERLPCEARYRVEGSAREPF